MSATCQVPDSEYDIQVLATHFVPEERETMTLRAMMEELDSEILRVEAHLVDLRAQRASIQSSYNVKKAMLAPVRKLPPETLGEIFLHCIPTNVHSPCSDAPLLLMRICSSWRRIAVGTPSLWTNLFLGSMCLDYCRIISMWLSNSGTLPIDINMHPSRLHDNFDNHRNTMRLIVENFHRFRRFSARLDVRLEQEIVRRMRPISAPLLEYFELRWCTNEEQAMTISHLEGSIDAPMLHSFSLRHPSARNIISFNPASIRCVTLCEDTTPENHIPLDFLASYGNMSSLDISLYKGLDAHPVDGYSRIILPSLKALKITFMTPHDRCPFLDAFEAPLLQDLDIKIDHMVEDGSLPHLMTMLDLFIGRHPPLQRLFLRNVEHMDSTKFISILSRLRNLRSLALSWSEVNDSILEALTENPLLPSSSSICPLLSTLDITSLDLSRDLLLQLIESRAPSNRDVLIFDSRHLRLVNVEFVFDPEDRGHERLGHKKLWEIGQRSGGILEIKSRQDGWWAWER